MTPGLVFGRLLFTRLKRERGLLTPGLVKHWMSGFDRLTEKPFIISANYQFFHLFPLIFFYQTFIFSTNLLLTNFQIFPLIFFYRTSIFPYLSSSTIISSFPTNLLLPNFHLFILIFFFHNFIFSY